MSKMKKTIKVGMIIAVEVEAFIRAYENKYDKFKVNGFDVYIVKYNSVEIFAIHSSAGQVFAAAATMLLINEYNVDIIINYGIVGSLIEDLKICDKCIVDKVVHYSFDTSDVDDCEVGRHLEYEDVYIPTSKQLIEMAYKVDSDLKLVYCASGDKFISDSNEKRDLNKKFNAHICEMEAAGILLIADRANVPCLIIKTISDSITGGSEEYKKSFHESSQLCMEIIKKIISNLNY